MSMVESHAPNWEAVQGEICCPLCDYNLRGLSEPRCPECGYAFAWDEILDPTRRLHPYLFEHHPERNVWSFVLTVSHGLSPRFWTTLHPAQPSRRNRLSLYMVIILTVAALPMAIDFFFRTPPQPSMFPYTYRTQVGWQFAYGVPSNMFCRPLLASTRQLLVAGFVASLALPALNYALLMIFQQTMRKGQLRPHHVQRCIIYSADVVLWVAPFLILMVVANLLPRDFNGWSENIAWTVLLTFPLIWLFITLRLISAYRSYLRFDHPIATVLSVQFIIFLLLPLILYSL